MTKPLQSNKRLAALIIALFMGFGTAQAAYDFAAACATGQTLYYQITDFTNYYVSIVAPGNSSEWWPENTVKPANMIVIPQTVSYYGIDFTVTSIANNAFYTCDGLTILLQVPNTVTSIGNHAFYGCSSLRIANIPNTINSIGNYAFYGCNSLTSITIPNLITSIGDYTFNGCSGLTSIEIPNSVTSIGNYAFHGCSGLTSIEIPNSVTSIGNFAFNGCTGLTSVEIPNSVTSIGNSAFRYCRGLTSIEIPNFVTSIGNYAFYNCSGLTSVEIGNSVTSIGECAFEDCTGLTSVEIPNSVTSIEYHAFSGCTGLTSVEIPNSVTSIGRTAFGACRGLTSIEIPNSVTTIESYAFGGCTGLTSITVQAETPPSLGNNAFFYVDNSIPVYVPCGTNSAYRSAPGWKDFNNYIQFGCGIIFADENVKAICIANWDTNGDGRLNYEEAAAVTTLNPSGQSFQSVFRGNTAITSFDELQYFTGLSTIENYAFFGCSGLTSIEIPNSVTSIGHYAFQNCTGLTSVEIPNSVTSIGNYAFQGCTGLTSVEIGNSVTSIGNAAFYRCSGLTSIEIPNSVTSIGSAAFEYCTGLTSVEIPNSVTSIGSAAFRNCTGLTSVEIPNSVSSIGEYAFRNCTGLTTVEIPNSVTSIGNYAFQSCTGLTSIVIPNSVTSIGNEAFDGCSGLTSIEIPNSVTSIGNAAFSYCSGLATMVVASGNTTYDSRDNCNAIIETATNTLVAGCKNTLIPNSVTSIGECAFCGCSGLTSIEIPNSVSSIGNSAFYSCSGLTSIEIPNSVTSIGNSAFYGCSGLTSIEIPNSVTSIGNSAFRSCTGLATMVVASGNTTYDSRDNCNAIIETATNTLVAGCKNTLIPNSVTSIGGSAFSVCSGLTSIEIPNSVTSIGNSAFYGCSGLTSIEVPNSVSSIGSNAFGHCSGLTEITMLRTDVPSLGYYVFDYTNDCPIYVPYESLNNYKTASKWSNYASRIYPMAYTAVSGYSEGGGKWKFIASPLTDNTEPTAVSNMTGTEYDLYRFNQSAELEWENYKVHDFDLVNGQGYLYANTEDVNLVFKGTFNEGSSQTITLIYDEGKDFAGWNLVGNPFPMQAYANRSYYTMNAAGTVIEPTAASTSTAIPACTGVMVKAETTGQSVTFSKTAPSAATNNGALQIAVAQANTRGAAVQDKAIVSFNAGDELGKFYFGESNAKLYIPQNGKELAIATAAKTGELPFNFKATKNGEYTLSFDVANVIASEAKQSNLSEQFAYLHLIDNMNGADVDLLVSPEYTFNAKTSDYASRFRLVFSANESDGDNDGDNAFAFIDAGGNLVINGEGTLQVIDMMGRVVVCRDASNASAISTNGIPAGVYILRLINGNDVMTQKIVIE